MPNKTIFKKKEKKTLLDKKLSDGNILKLTLRWYTSVNTLKPTQLWIL